MQLCECYRCDGTIGNTTEIACKWRFISQHEVALKTSISLYRGPTVEPGRGLIYQGLSKMDEEGLWQRSVSLCGSSIKGTWSEGSCTGDTEGYAK